MINELKRIAQKYKDGATIVIDGDRKIITVSWVSYGHKPGYFTAPDGSRCNTEIFGYA